MKKIYQTICDMDLFLGDVLDMYDENYEIK